MTPAVAPTGFPSVTTDLERGRGGHTAPSRSEVADALTALDQLGLLVDADADVLLSDRPRERYASNLLFFQGFGSLSMPAAAYQRRLLDAHTVLVGLGGAGSMCLMALAGLGLGRLTLIDGGLVQSQHLARQFIYRHSDIGRPKADATGDWLRRFDPSIDVRTVWRWIQGPADLSPLVRGADLVVLAGDESAEGIEARVNALCVAAGVPYVTGAEDGRVAPPAAAGRHVRVDVCTGEIRARTRERWSACPACSLVPNPAARSESAAAVKSAPE